MPRPAFPRTVLEFQKRFAAEEACLEYLIASRWSEGFVCPRCERLCTIPLVTPGSDPARPGGSRPAPSPRPPPSPSSRPSPLP